MSATHYSNPDSQATFSSQSTKPISDQQLPVESKHNRDLLFEAAIQALQPDASPGRNLRRAAACGGEMKRLLLIERPHIRNRRARLTVEMLAAVADRMIVAIEQLSAGGRFGESI